MVLNPPRRDFRHGRLVFLLIPVFLVTFFAQTVHAQASRTDPVLQLSTGGPTGITRAMALTSDGAELITGGDDQPIRIWDTATGELKHVIRGEVGFGIDGAVTSLALSPGDEWLAVGIFYPHQEGGREVRGFLRIYDYRQKKLVRLLYGHPAVVLSLDFSPSGRYMVSGEGGPESAVAIVWDTTSWQKVNELRGHTGQIYGAAFLGEDRVATAAWDRTVRIWDWRSGSAVEVMKEHKDNIMSLAYSPRTNQLATGGMDKTIYVWDAARGKKVARIKTKRALYKIDFTPDGSHIVASTRGEGDQAYVDVIQVSREKVVETYKDTDFTVISMLVTHDGQEVISAGGSRSEIDFWSLRSGKRRMRIVGDGSPHFAVGLSEDGRTVYWGDVQDDRPDGPLQYRMALYGPQNTLAQPKRVDKTPRSVVRARHKVGDLSLDVKTEGGYYAAVLEIKKKRKVIGTITRDARSGHKHRSYTFTPDGRYVISGALVGRLGIYDLSGRQIGTFEGHLGVVTDLAVSNDGRFLVSASRDQTIRLWDVASTELLLSIFPGRDGQWIAWLPDGHYASSADGDRYIGWQLNRGVDRDADYFGADQFRQRLFRPDLIDDQIHALLGLQTEKKPEPEFAALTPAPDSQQKPKTEPEPEVVVGKYDKAVDTIQGFSIAALAEPDLAPPGFDIVSPRDKATTKQRELDVTLEFEDNPNPVERVEVFLNGSRTTSDATRGLGVSRKTDAHTETVRLALQPGENTIELVAYNAVGQQARRLTVFLETAQQDGTRGTLYLVSVGVNEYDNLEQDLAFAAADATDFSRALAASTRGLYQDVKTVLIADGARAPTRQNILQAITLFKAATPHDTVVLFLAGHGVMEGTDYLFLPAEARLTPTGWDRTSVVPWQEIQQSLAGSAGRRILFVDTCKSGNAFNPRLVKDAADSNIVVMTSTDGETLAQERNKLGHGVFTYSILEGLKGKADTFKDGKITMTELNAYITNAVDSMTKGEQIPVLHVPGGFKNFAFATL